MKQLFLIGIILLGIGKVNALPVGNPSGASLFFEEECCEDICFFDDIGFSLGFYGDYVFNRHLETDTGRKIDYTQISTNAGYFAVNFWELFDVFATLGASKFTFNTSLAPFNSTNTHPRFDFESTTSFSWSVGARGSLWEWRCFTWGIEGQYFASNPDPKVLFVRKNVDLHPDEGNSRRYSEWQVGTGISWRYNPYFVPYTAVKYSRACWNFNHQTFLVTNTLANIPTLRSSNHWGYAVGLTLAPLSCRNLEVTVEGRFGDEKALYINGQMHF